MDLIHWGKNKSGFFILFSLFSAVLFLSCVQKTDYENDDSLHTISDSYNNISLSLTGTGYGTYNQQIFTYTSGTLSSILKDDENYFSIKSSATDAASSTSNTITLTYEFTESNISSIDYKYVLPKVNGVSSITVTAYKGDTSVKSFTSPFKTYSAASSSNSSTTTKISDFINNDDTYTLEGSLTNSSTISANKLIVKISMAKYNSAGQLYNSELKIYKLIPKF